MTGGRRIFIWLLVIAVLVFVISAIAAARVRPMLSVLARSEARDFVIRSINTAIELEIEYGNMEHNRLVSFERDFQGNITALIANSATINILQTRISNNVVDLVENVIDANMSIPIGNAFGGVLFLGRGPRIPIRIPSVTNIETQFRNEFSSAGINQTRHNIVLEILVEVDIILPSDRETTIVATEVVIAETVIVGVVPNVYADIWRMLE